MVCPDNETVLRDALKLCEKAIEAAPRNSQCWNEAGLIYMKCANYKKAIECYEQALSIDKAAYGDKHPTVAIRLNNLGAAWKHCGQFSKAIEFYNQALSIDKSVYRNNHPKVAIRLYNLGAVYCTTEQFDKAAILFKQSLDIFKNTLGIAHPSTKTTEEHLTQALEKLKNQTTDTNSQSEVNTGGWEKAPPPL
ncbi:MAG: tetratricopeptide repeat protein [Nitrospirae bacterium YQR-1]